MDNTLSYTTWMLNSMTRLYGLQCEAAKAALQLQQQRLEALLEAKQVSDVAGEPMRLFSSGMEHAMDAMRKSSALMQEMHAELLQLAHQSLSGFSQASQESAETALPPQKDVGTASKPKRRAS
jgi:hypothetical protein